MNEPGWLPNEGPQPELVRGFIRHDQDTDPLFGASPPPAEDLPLLIFLEVDKLTTAQLLLLAEVADANRPVITYREEATRALPIIRGNDAHDCGVPPGTGGGCPGSALVGGQRPAGASSAGRGHAAVVAGRAGVDGHAGFDSGTTALKGRR